MKRKWIAGAIGLLIFTATFNLHAADFLPLAAGNAWTYRNAPTGESFSIQVGVPVLMNQRIYHSLRGYTKDPVLVRFNEYGNVVYWDEETEQDILLTSFEPIRAHWEAPQRECVDQGETPEARGTHDGPAGRWSVVEIRYRSFSCADAGHLSEQFTENIGMVRRVINTIAGSRTFDLVHARIGNQTIASGDVGSFSVTTAIAPELGGWIATLRIDLPAQGTVKLHFPSSQEYDLRLRDADGNILWAWSADKLFAQVTHELVIRGGLSVNVEVPFPPTVPEGPNVFTLEAWLTSDPRGPQFAAATTAVIPAFR